jgi:hypothetical protein
MAFVIIGVAFGSVYLLDRAVALRNKLRGERRRAKAEYPITANDPTGRLIA